MRYYILEVQIHGLTTRNQRQEEALIQAITSAVTKEIEPWRGEPRLTGDVTIYISESGGEFDE